MIVELYTFSPGSYVVAEEWNANFRTLYKANVAHLEAIVDANAEIAFPTSDLTNLFNRIKVEPNSWLLGALSVRIAPEQEYYKSLGENERLSITIPTGTNAEARILVYFPDTRTDLDDLFIITYDGDLEVGFGYYDYEYFRPGYYYIMIYEANGVAQVKLIWTGV